MYRTINWIQKTDSFGPATEVSHGHWPDLIVQCSRNVAYIYMFVKVHWSPSPYLLKNNMNMQHIHLPYLLFYLFPEMDQVQKFLEPTRLFAKDSIRLVKRCTKPDRRGKLEKTLLLTSFIEHHWFEFEIIPTEENPRRQTLQMQKLLWSNKSITYTHTSIYTLIFKKRKHSCCNIWQYCTHIIWDQKYLCVFFL